MRARHSDGATMLPGQRGSRSISVLDRYMDRRLARRALSVTAVLVLLIDAVPAPAEDGPVARFDWSMPERFGPDARSLNGEAVPDGLRDYLVTFQDTWDGIDPGNVAAGSVAVNPPAWRVDFDATESEGSIVTYRWSVEGVEVGVEMAPAFSYEFPDEGTYAVTLVVEDSSGGSAETTVDVTVQDFLIVAVGDSYGSGEGNPEPSTTGWFLELVEAYAALADANAELQDALSALTEAQIQLELTVDEVRPALEALATWSAECPSLSVACAQATTRLITELVKLGFNEAADLISEGYQYVRTQIQNLVKVKEAAVAAARAAVGAAQESFDAARDLKDIILDEGASWQDRSDVATDAGSHRSSFSGQALAALALERSDPRTSVTFIHLAYSGARIVRELESRSAPLIIGSETRDTPLEGVVYKGGPQLDDVLRLVGNREIDALVISIGGNDVGFAKIIESLVLNEGEVCDLVRARALSRCGEALSSSLPPTLVSYACGQLANALEARCHALLGGIESIPHEGRETLLEEGLGKLRDTVDGEGNVLEKGRFSELADGLAERLPELPAHRVYLTEYPNLVEDDAGNTCPDYLSVTTEEWRWVGETMTVELNAAVADAADQHGWNVVSGVYDGFRRHGYCAEDHWVVRAEETFLIQGDASGAAHPTAAGHQVYGSRIWEHMASDLYPYPDPSRPRPAGYPPRFLRGDANADGELDITDAVITLQWLYAGGTEPGCLAAANTNPTESDLDLTDAVAGLSYLYQGGPAPPAPFPNCGHGIFPVDTELGCATLSEACP